MSRVMLTGHAAIEYAATHDGALGKFGDPIEDARYPVPLDEARAIAREDPSLIYWLSDEQIYRLQEEAAAAGDMDQIAVCNLALSKVPAMRAECANVIRAAQAMEG